jgi:hypothetical protein
MTVYATSPLIGSPSKMYDMLVESAQKVLPLYYGISLNGKHLGRQFWYTFLIQHLEPYS